ncbi:AMP-binding protein [Aquimarina agarivorans]|uniref:AMP-binding protein n=1 Tax=Aquimarina agarivorans TaxID=980584 RepID=UPI000248F2F4|nr:AMP-binding protein [Aquimarina agarivorans]
MSFEEKFITPDLHASFLLNNKRYTNSSLEAYAHHLVRTGEEFEVEIGDFLLDWLDDSDIIEVKTSGSTGPPKTIEVYKTQMINSAKATGTFFKIPEESNALLCLSAKYIAGKMMLVRAMILGWKLDVLAPKSNPLDNLYKQYDFCAMVPLQLDNSINRLHLLKKLIVGGGAIPEHLIALVQGLNTKIYETYGMTETVTHVAARRVNSKKKEIKDCCFKALPQVAFSTDERNCLVIKAPMLSKEAIVTNDIVDLITFKKFFWKGRFDNVINSGGIKLHPEEIEKKLQLVIRERFFVTSRDDKKLGQRLILIIENVNDAYTIDTYFFKINNLDTLDKYEVPKEIYFLENFIETNTGKIHRSNNVAQLFAPLRKA